MHITADAFLVRPSGSTRFSIEGNQGAGIRFDLNGRGLVVGGLQVSANGVDLDASGAGVVNLGSLPQLPSVIDGNGTDVVLLFGTRVEAHRRSGHHSDL